MKKRRNLGHKEYRYELDYELINENGYKIAELMSERMVLPTEEKKVGYYDLVDIFEEAIEEEGVWLLEEIEELALEEYADEESQEECVEEYLEQIFEDATRELNIIMANKEEEGYKLEYITEEGDDLYDDEMIIRYVK